MVLGVGVAWDQFIKPNQVVAEVNGVRIRRDNYWRYRSVELINQISSYQQFANSATDAQQQQQYLGLATRASQELGDLWGSRDVNDDTVQRMIEDQIYIQNLEPMGITITDDQVDLWINQQFAPLDAPLVAPTAEPTLIPERAAWATQTAEAAGGGDRNSQIPERPTQRLLQLRAPVRRWQTRLPPWATPRRSPPLPAEGSNPCCGRGIAGSFAGKRWNPWRGNADGCADAGCRAGTFNGRSWL